MEQNKYPLVFCIWEDIVATDTNWRDKEAADEWVKTETGRVHQTGFLLSKDDQYLVLMDSYFPYSTTVGSVTRIPSQNIIQCITLNVEI